MYISYSQGRSFGQKHQEIPILDIDQLSNNFNNEIEAENNNAIVVRNNIGDIYCTKVADNSMSPLLRKSSLIIFEQNKPDYKIKDSDILICNLKEINAIIIRKVSILNNKKLLVPENKDLYNTIDLNRNISIIGKIIENRANFPTKGVNS